MMCRGLTAASFSPNVNIPTLALSHEKLCKIDISFYKTNVNFTYPLSF